MAQHSTRKDTREARSETQRRRQVRAVKRGEGLVYTIPALVVVDQ